MLPGQLADVFETNLLIMDELGDLSQDRHRANLFFQVINRLDEKGSVIPSTDRRFETCGEIFAGDAVIAGAILDRLRNHRQLLAIHGRSHRTPDLSGTTGD